MKGIVVLVKKHEHIYRSYKRNHSEENIREVEEKKIKLEVTAAKKKNKQIKKKIESVLNFNYLDDIDMDDIDNLLYEEKKIRGNRRTHKKRLVELKKNKDIY